jgi:hypothetical protein
MALWANLHGGYLAGLGILVIWTAVRFYQADPRGPALYHLLALGLASLAGTLANPYGVGLWLFLRETVGATRTGIADWQPLLQTGPIGITQWMIVTAIAALAFRKRRIDPAYGLIAGCLGLATLAISRFDAFYALAVVMLLGPYLGGDPLPAASPGPRLLTVGLAVSGAVALGIGALAQRSSCIEMRNVPEPEATAFAAGLNGRMVTFFDWGEYAIWHLAPQVQVSMDGRRETVYSDRVTASHMRIYTNAPDAVTLVEAMRPDWIWFPRHWGVIGRLEAAGWHAAFLGPVSVILGREPTSAIEVQTASSLTRCFPQY